MGKNLSLNRFHFSPTMYDLKKIMPFSGYPPSSGSTLDVKEWLRKFVKHIDSTGSFPLCLKFFDKQNPDILPLDLDFSRHFNQMPNHLGGSKKTIESDLLSLYGAVLDAKRKEREALRLNLAILIVRFENDSELKHIAELLPFIYCVWLSPEKYKAQLKGRKKLTVEELNIFLKELKPEIDALPDAQQPSPSELQLLSTLEAQPSAKSAVDQKRPRIANGYPLEQADWERTDNPWKAPLQSFVETHYLSAEKQREGFSEEFLLKKPIEGNTLLDTRFTELSEAYQEMPKTYTEYQIKGEVKILSEELQQSLVEEAKDLQQLETHLQKMLEWPSDEQLDLMDSSEQKRVYELRQSYINEKRERPDLRKDLLASVCFQDPQILHEVNPFLAEQNLLPELYRLAILYLLKTSKEDQTKEALDFLSRGQIHSAGEVLAKQRLYNPYEYPTILMYEYVTGLMLRNEPDQAKLLQEMIAIVFNSDPQEKKEQALRRLFIEFQAGGGKTKVISVIVAAMAFKEGKNVAFFGLSAQLDVVRMDLGKTLQQVYKEGVIPLDIRLNDTVSNSWIEGINDTLADRPVCLIMAPESWHSLKLQWQQAMARKEYELAENLAKFFTHLETNALFIIDEEHINVSSMTEAVIATGKIISYPDYAGNLVCDIQDLLFGWGPDRLALEDGTFIDEALGLAEHSPSLVSEDKKKQLAILTRVAEHLADKAFECTPKKRVDLILYLTTRKVSAPKFLQKIRRQDPALGKRIDLARGLLVEALPLAFSQKRLIDYGPSTDDGIFQPLVLGESNGQKYEDPDFAAVLTTQGYRQLGLNPYAMNKYLEVKVSAYLASNKDAYLSDEFSKINPPLSLEGLVKKKLDDPELLEQFCQQIGNNREVIQYYERHCAFKDIKIFSNKFHSTGQELSVGGWAAIHTSATLGYAEANPFVDPSNYRTMDAFSAQVIQRALLDPNSQTVWSEAKTPLTVLNSLLGKVDFSQIAGMINIGGLCETHSNEEWAKCFFLFNKENKLGYSAVLTAKIVNTQASKNSEKTEKRLFIMQEGQPDALIEGSDVKAAIKKLGLTGKRIFNFFSADMTTGTDLPLPPDAKMIVTVGEKVTLPAYVQGIMRMRGFLLNLPEGERPQRIIWVGENKFSALLEERMQQNTPSAILSWSLHKESQESKSAIQSRARQDIEMVIRSITNPTFEREPKKYPNHRLAYEIPLGYNPTEKYSREVALENTKDVLWRYTDELSKKANVNLEEYAVEKERIKQGIDQVHAKIEQMENSSHTDLLACAQQQQQEQQQEQQQQQKVMRGFNLTPYAENDSAIKTYPINSSETSPQWSANHRFNTDLFSPNLILTENFYRVEKTCDLLKPADFVMIWTDANGSELEPVCEFRVISDRDAEIYSEQLRNPKREDHKVRTAIIFGTNGEMYQTDRAQNLTIEDVENIKKRPEFQTILAEIGLINGRIMFPLRHPPFFLKRKSLRPILFWRRPATFPCQTPMLAQKFLQTTIRSQKI